MSAALRPFTIPPESPLASGWRFQVAQILEIVGVHDLMDAVAAYAELRCRHEPDNCSVAEEAAQGGWYRSAPSFRKLAEPAQRRIQAVEEPRGPGRPRREQSRA